MKTDLKIQDYALSVDVEVTRQLYSQEIKIADDCTCDGCQFFSTIFIKENIEIFKLLTSIGVDLEKNMRVDDSGLWCVLDDNGNLLYCEQSYSLVGDILSPVGKGFRYSKTELGFQISAFFANTVNDHIVIYLTIELAKT